ncbi:MAG: TdeIII family type II restriction endonuclease [Treponema sp.]|nr:TdeIII family type II restriction endonuclease [Treponema sp.]
MYFCFRCRRVFHLEIARRKYKSIFKVILLKTVTGQRRIQPIFRGPLKVAEEFWDFLGSTGTYKDLLDSFEKVGVELRHEIDEYFRKHVK